MDIVLVIHRLQPNRGGAETWTVRFANWLIDQGHRVRAVSAAFPEKPSVLRAEPIRVARRDHLGFCRSATQVVRSLQADVIHDMGFTAAADLFHPHCGPRAALNQARLHSLSGPRRTTFELAQRFGIRQRRLAALERRQFSAGGTRFLAVSEKVADAMTCWYRVPADRIHVVPNGADVDAFQVATPAEKNQSRQRLGVAEREVSLLFVAHNHRLKGLDAIVQVLDSLRSECVFHLYVVGGAGPRETRRLSTGHRLTVIGQSNDVRSWYQAVDAFVLPTWYDACSLTVLEAMASGLPVVTTRCNGASELIRHGDSGLVVNDPFDTAGLVSCLVRISDADCRVQLGRAARIAAERNSLARNFRAVERVYEGIAAVRKAA